ncbi:MAG: PIN domain-containing protein [Ignavibacteriae bacterium]|nr:PIN domain-containing protein [Ignavibacteriota bacterium]
MMEADAGLTQIIVPTIVLSEVLMIGEKKRITFDYGEFLSNLVTSENYTIHPFDFDILLQMRRLEAIPELHDRIIVATALITESALITKDREIISSGIVQTFW